MLLGLPTGRLLPTVELETSGRKYCGNTADMLSA